MKLKYCLLLICKLVSGLSINDGEWQKSWMGQDDDGQELAARRQSKEWWQHATIYQIYPRSFADSNEDGVGDLPGITSKLDHLSDIGVDTIWMSPIFKSPQKDFGYDVSDFYGIHEEYGTMDDFDVFIAASNKLNIKVLLDFVPNHSSDQCEWFKKSMNNEPKYRDYYVWHSGFYDSESNKTNPPNNWVFINFSIC